MRKSLHESSKPKSLRTRSLINRDTIPIRIFINNEEAIRNISTRRSNSLRCYCRTVLFGELRLSEFKGTKWLISVLYLNIVVLVAIKELSIQNN